jgi:DNA helicase HerA-like ATPase
VSRPGSDLRWIRVLSSPAGDAASGDSPLRRAILAGLLDAGVRRTPAAALWVRPEPYAALQVYVAGALRSRPDGHGDGAAVPLLFPLGATGHVPAEDEVEALLARFPAWAECGGGFDPLLADTDEAGRALDQRWHSAPLDDVAGYLAHQAFAWLVVGHPVANSSLEAELSALRRELYRLKQSGRLSEADVIELERGEAWFRELSRGGPAGAWDLSVAVGAADAATSRDVASILCGAAERSTSHYRLRPVDGDGAGGGFRATADLVAALVRPPETELPGLRVVALPTFDTTPEGTVDPADSLRLGRVLDRFARPSGPFTVSLDTLNRHSFVCGATGGGKSWTVRALLEALARHGAGIPWLVIEPAKAEYARMAGRLADLGRTDVLVIRPGDRRAAPAGFNPLEPASLAPGDPDRTFPLQSHADLVRALFVGALRADEPFPQVLSRALTECYEAAGWDLVTGLPLRVWDRDTGQPSPSAGGGLPRYPTLGSLQQRAFAVVEEIGYGDNVRKDVQGFVDVRIGSLRTGAPGRLFEGGHPLDFAALLLRNVVFELEGITNDQDKAFVMGALLIRLYEQLLLEERERFAREGTDARVRHVTVIEEAHRLLRKLPLDAPGAHSLELFASLLAEVRAYGEGIVVAEQIPSKLIPDVIKNTALKIVHRLPAADDREAVGGTMNLSEEQSQYVVTLAPGDAAVFTDGMDRPLLVRMPDAKGRESASAVTHEPCLAGGGRRSRACGRHCREGAACTLEQIRRAERLLDAHPQLTLWTEISFAAHASGLAAPEPARTRQWRELAQVGRDDARLLECAIAHAVERAVADRYHPLATFFDPDALGRHIADVAEARLLRSDTGNLCAADAGRWRSGLERFADVVHWLRRLAADEAAPLSHAELVTRVRERGVELGEGSAAEHAQYLESLPWAHWHGGRQRTLVAGARSPTRALTAAEALVGAGDAAHQLATAAGRVLAWPEDDAKDVLQNLIPPNRAAQP